jgi:hypothetical protein
MNVMYSLHLLQQVSANVHGHRQVVVQIHNKKSILRKSLPFSDKYIFRGLVIIPNLLLLLQSALQPLVGFRPAQLSLRILSRKVLLSAVASGTSNPQLGGEPGI